MDNDIVITSSPQKLRIAKAIARTPVSIVARRVESFRPIVRIFNYHAVPPRLAQAFDDQLALLGQRFRLASAAELEDVIEKGPGQRSVAFISLDDGLSNHFEVAAPILERHGVHAFFSIPAGFAEGDPDWFGRNVYPVRTELHAEAGDVQPMPWDQMRALARRGHRICSHGFDHVVLTASTGEAVLRREIVESRSFLEERLPGVQIEGFCWPGSSVHGAMEAMQLIEQTYSFSLGTDVRPFRRHARHGLPRVNLEAGWPRELLELQLSGLLDGLYAMRRLRRG
jgi:peptidoglycan/xylan/chitin deacetylase (PgdA/CDA1 family)